MFVRLLLSGAVVCGLLATDGAALAEPAAARKFKGRTAQGYPIKLVAKGSKLRLLHFEADLKCRDGSVVTLVESGFLWTATDRNRSFHDAQFGTTDSVYFRGQMSERRVRGRLRLADKERRGPRCKSRWISFNATPR